MKQVDKEQKDILSILFFITLCVYLLICAAVFLYHPSQTDYLKDKAPFVLTVLKALSIPILFIYKNLFFSISAFICFSFLFKLFLGKKFYFTTNQSLYPFRYWFVFFAFIIPLLATKLYVSFLAVDKTQFVFAGIVSFCIILGYTLFAYFLRLQFGHVNQFSKRFDERIKMPLKAFHSETSISLPIKPNHYVNIVNPFRGIMIIGGPGSGKSWSIIEPIIDQVIHKGYTSLIYDFKFPTLAGYAYASYDNAKRASKTTAEFRVIYFRDPRYSNRCNPLDPKLLSEYATANQAASTILLNINRTWAQKQGEFFSDSAIIILTAIIWYLRCKAIELNKNICTLGHVIEFASYADYAKTIEILTEHPEVKNTIVALQSAKQTGAMEQLGGQLGSLQIALSKLNDKKMIYVMSGNDFTLDINKPGNEQVVILGNDNEFKDTYAPALSLYAAITTRLINQQKRKPCALIIDEFPTMYIQNYEQLPATARSNKVACIIAMQDLAQLRDAYGQSKEKTITATHGNIFIGSTPEKNTAQFASDLIGKDIIQKKSYQKNDQHNYNISEQADLIIYPHEIQQLNQGEFVGIVSDLDPTISQTNTSYEDRIKKVFAGKLDIVKPKHYYTDSNQNAFLSTIPMAPHFNTAEFQALSEQDQLSRIDRITTENITEIRQQINDLILTEYWYTIIWRYLDSASNKNVREFIQVSKQLTAEASSTTKMKAIEDYIAIAIAEEQDIKANPSRASELSKATNISLTKVVEALESDSSTFWALEQDNESTTPFEDILNP